MAKKKTTKNKVLTKEMAERYLGLPVPSGQSLYQVLSARLRRFKLIDDAAARILFEEIISKHDDFIVLNLTQLPEVAAQGLAKLTGDGVTLDLDRLSELSEAAAESLRKGRANPWLTRVSSVSDAAAEILGKRRYILGDHQISFNRIPASATLGIESETLLISTLPTFVISPQAALFFI